MVSFPRVSPPKPCIHLYPPYVLHSPPISFFSILSPDWFLVRSADHKAPNYVVFSTPLLPRPSSKYTPQHPILSNPQPSVSSSLNMKDQVSHPYKGTGKINVMYILILKFLDNKLKDKIFRTEWQQAFPDFNLLLNFFANAILICLECSQTSELLHPFKGFSVSFCTVILSRTLFSTHDHVLSSIGIYF